MFEALRHQLDRLRRRLVGGRSVGDTTNVGRVRSSSMNLEFPEEEVIVAEETSIGVPAKVILYNDEIHTFDEVIVQLIKATGCTSAEAETLALEVDSRGLAVVYEGDVDRCLKVSSVLEEIALHTSIEF